MRKNSSVKALYQLKHLTVLLPMASRSCLLLLHFKKEKVSDINILNSVMSIHTFGLTVVELISGVIAVEFVKV